MAPPPLTPNPATFALAVESLDRFRRLTGLRSINFGVAVAVLMHSAGRRTNGPPLLVHRPAGGPVLENRALEELCDFVFAKDASYLPPGAEGPIYKPFTLSFKQATRNNWRNSFALQTGLGCDAPPTTTYLLSPQYLAQDRIDCTFRNKATALCQSRDGFPTKQMCFNPNKRGPVPSAPGEAAPCPKLLARAVEDGVRGYWCVEPTSAVVGGLLPAPSKRVPLYPFLFALYGGSSYFAAWGTIATPQRLRADLGLAPVAFSALFDDSLTNLWNSEFLAALGWMPPSPAPALSLWKPKSKALPRPRRFERRTAGQLKAKANAEPDPERRRDLLERANERHVATLNGVCLICESLGFDPEEQLGGFDLRADGHLFEVKSWTPQNLASQVRHGWSQLLEYRFLNRLPAKTHLYLVLDREPPESWRWDFLMSEHQILPCWLRAGKLATFPRFESALGARGF